MNRKVAVIAFAVFTICALIVGGVAFVSITARGAGTNATEEAAIRKIIAAQNEGTPPQDVADRIEWTGAFKRPDCRRRTA